jgi:hypothetical protein
MFHSFGRVLLRSVGKLIAWPVRRHIAAFEAATHEPQRVQEALLRRILARQAATDFGRAHHFHGIHTPADFRRHIPVAGYDYIAPYIDRVRRGDIGALLTDRRLYMFALTSGTTATRKLIPVNDQYLADYKRGWNIWGLQMLRDHRPIILRPIVQISGDWQEFRAESGVPCGAVTGLTATMQKRIIRWLYCVPACVGRIKDARAKYYVTLRLSMHRDVALLVAANPSTLINLARAGDQEKERLIRDLHDGTLDRDLDLPPEVRKELTPRLRPHPEKARDLAAIAEKTGKLYPRDYWPKPMALGNWTGGSVGAYLRQFPRYYGDAAVRDVGLIASEGRMTIPLADNSPSGVLDITSHYFEFLPEDQADATNPITVAAHEVEVGKKYFILPTTAYGLYRYHIFDLVRVTGFHNRTPLVEFLNKGAHFSNLTGEKLSEYQVTRGMEDALRELDLTVTAYTVAPCWDEVQPYYGLFVERGDFATREQGLKLAHVLDKRLAQLNVEYEGKRSSLRLGSMRLELLPAGTWREWDSKRLARTGGTMEQYKHPCLVPDPEFRSTLPSVEEAIGAA